MLRFAFGLLLVVVLLHPIGEARAQNRSLDALERIESLEEAMKEIRGILEKDLHQLKQAVEGGGSLSGDQLQQLTDAMIALNNRVERMLGVVSDNEFRLLRLEKRVETIMRLGLEGVDPNSLSFSDGSEGSITSSLSSSALSPNPLPSNTLPSNQGAGEIPQASLTTNQDQSAIISRDSASNTSNDNVIESVAVASGSGSSVLPAVAPEDQYSFALGKALQNDLTLADSAFSEFIAVNPEHSRLPDAHFWLGRVQFMQGDYPRSVETFSTFQERWPDDARIEKTTLWIGEAVVNFSTPEEACSLLEDLPSFLVDTPSDNFYDRLTKLKDNAGCES